MNIPLPPPIVSVRDVLPALGFTPVWGTATDLEPAYAFKGGGIDILVSQVTSLYLRPEFIIGGSAFNARSLKWFVRGICGRVLALQACRACDTGRARRCGTSDSRTLFSV